MHVHTFVDKSRVQMQEPRPLTVARWRPGGASELESNKRRFGVGGWVQVQETGGVSEASYCETRCDQPNQPRNGVQTTKGAGVGKTTRVWNRCVEAFRTCATPWARVVQCESEYKHATSLGLLIGG